MAASTERVTVRMVKGEAATDWGFRLQGGRDYGGPLTIGKVLEGGLAQRAGLLEGDTVAQIGSVPAVNIRNQMADNVISQCGNTLDIVVERPATRIWKPQVTPVDVPPGDMTSPPVRYSLAHHPPQEYSTVGSSHNVQPRPFGQPQQPMQQRQASSTTTKISEQYTSPRPPQSKSKVDEYLQKTGGLFGTDPKLNQKLPEPTYLRSETLRLIKESESRSSSSPAQQQESQKGQVDGPAPRAAPADAPGAPACTNCGRPIHGVFCTVGGKTLHGECFKCSTCGSSLKNIGYFLINDKLYCDVHARQQREQQIRPSNVLPHVTKLGPPAPQGREVPIQHLSTDQNKNYTSSYQQYHKTTKTTSTSSGPNQQQPYSISIVAPGENHEKPPAPVSAPPPPPPNISISAPPSAPSSAPNSNIYSSDYKNRALSEDSVFYHSSTIRTAPRCRQHKAIWPPPADNGESEEKVNRWKVPAKLSRDFGPGCRDFEDDEKRLLSYRSFCSGQGNAFETLFAPHRDINRQEDSKGEEHQVASPGETVKLCAVDNNGQSNSIDSQKQDDETNKVIQPAEISNICRSIAQSKIIDKIDTPCPFEKSSSLDTTRLNGNEVKNFLSILISSVAAAADTAVMELEFPQVHFKDPQNWSAGTTEKQWTGATPMGKAPARRGRGILKQLHEAPRIPTCESCNREIRGPFVLALSKCWCPEHFICDSAQCQRKLLDIGFIEENGMIYCEGCYEKYFAPMCFKCSRPIVGDCLTALERHWHPECFVCTHCRATFGNTSFFVENGQPYCEKDWNQIFTTKCYACQFPIEAGDRWVEALGNAYHSDCFSCSVCQKNLEGQSFYAKAGRPYCKAHA